MKQHGARRGAVPKKRLGAAPLKTRAVLFVEQTPQGELAKRIKEQLIKMESILGYSTSC